MQPILKRGICAGLKSPFPGDGGGYWLLHCWYDVGRSAQKGRNKNSVVRDTASIHELRRADRLVERARCKGHAEPLESLGLRGIADCACKPPPIASLASSACAAGLNPLVF